MKKVKGSKGITLIALVITVTVLSLMGMKQYHHIGLVRR